MSPGPRRLYRPRRAQVKADREGLPLALAETEVEAVREAWVVEDRWWTPRPLRRRYYELVLADGRDVTVFEQLPEGRWYLQRG